MRHAILFFAIPFLLSAPANATSPRNSLTSPRWVYTALVKTFPEFVEHIGGFSYEISLRELTCASSIVDENNTATLSTECTAVGIDGRIVTRAATDLFLTLLNSNVRIDRKSEPGTTYVLAQDLECALIDPKPSGPDDKIVREYSCSISK